MQVKKPFIPSFFITQQKLANISEQPVAFIAMAGE